MKAIAVNLVDLMFRAFSDPTRLRMLSLLLPGELCLCDILSTLRIAQPTASRHLAYLRKSGLVDSRRDGLCIYYTLSTPKMAFHKKLIDSLGCCLQDVPQLAKDAKLLK